MKKLKGSEVVKALESRTTLLRVDGIVRGSVIVNGTEFLYEAAGSSIKVTVPDTKKTMSILLSNHYDEYFRDYDERDGKVLEHKVVDFVQKELQPLVVSKLFLIADPKWKFENTRKNRKSWRINEELYLLKYLDRLFGRDVKMLKLKQFLLEYSAKNPYQGASVTQWLCEAMVDVFYESPDTKAKLAELYKSIDIVLEVVDDDKDHTPPTYGDIAKLARNHRCMDALKYHSTTYSDQGEPKMFRTKALYLLRCTKDMLRAIHGNEVSAKGVSFSVDVFTKELDKLVLA